jgi:hypothetical protein
MSGLDDFRKKFPQYNDMSDANLTNSLYSKHYSDMPRAEFDKKMGVDDVSKEVASMRQGSALKRGARGAGASLQNLGYGFKGIFSDLTPEQQQTVNVNKRFLDEDTAGFVGGLATDAASFALPGGAALKVARALPAAMRLAKSAPLLAPLAGNAALDAGLSAAYSTGDRSDAALAGGLGSAGGQLALRGLGRALGGAFTPSDAARRLMDRGIQPTVGQSVGGLANRTEQAIAGVPIVGSPINRARTRTNEEVLREGARLSDRNIDLYRGNPGIVDLPKNVTGDELLKVVNSNASALYDNVLARIGNIDMSNSLQGLSILARKESAAKGIKDPSLQTFIDETIAPALSRSGTMDGPTWKRIDSQLGQNAETFSASPVASDRQLGAVYKELREWWRGDLQNKVPIHLSEQLKSADAAWREAIPLERAATTARASRRGGLPTGDELQASTKVGDRSQFDRNQRYNPNEMEALAKDASEATGNTLGDSGTALRSAAMLGVSGAGAGLAGFVPTAATLAASRAATQLGYSRPVQKFLLGGYDKQKAILDALRRFSPYAGDIGASFSE